LAEFMNKNWDTLVGRTNEDVAQELGYKAANMISMWRTGKTRIPLERVPDVARLMHLDIAIILPLWFEQYWGERSDAKAISQVVFSRFATAREGAVLEKLREGAPMTDPVYSGDQIDAMVAAARHDDVCKKTLEYARKKGVVAPKIAIVASAKVDDPAAAPVAAKATPKAKRTGSHAATAK
jgi:hypothetical protein